MSSSKGRSKGSSKESSDFFPFVTEISFPLLSVLVKGWAGKFLGFILSKKKHSDLGGGRGGGYHPDIDGHLSVSPDPPLLSLRS